MKNQEILDFLVNLSIPRHVLLAHGQVRGQVLLDGHGDVQGNIPAEIRDAEAAVAQHPVELEVLHPGALR